MKTYGRDHALYVSDVSDGTWPKGIDAPPTNAPTGPPSESSSPSSSEDVVEKAPKRQQPPQGKEPARPESVKKKKQPNTLPPRKSGRISIREPLASLHAIMDWSDDGEDAGEMLLQQAARMAALTPTIRAFNRPAQGTTSHRHARGEVPEPR